MILEYSNKTRPLLLAVVVLLCPLALNAQIDPSSKNPSKNLTPANVKAPDFVLLDQDNQRFASETLRGKVVALNFIFTTCTDVCPIFTANLAQLQRTLNDRYGGELFFVSITTDPEIDSPKVLKAYGKRYSVDFKNWAFLTGSEGELIPVWKSFGIRVIKKARGLVQHVSLTTVIDRQGARRFNHYGEKWRTKDLEKDLLSLLEKKT